jgi:hypothetical protein
MHLLALLLQSQPDPDAAKNLIEGVSMILPVIALIVVAIILVPFWKICKKAGFAPGLSLLCFLGPLGFTILIYVLAFARWKVVPVPQSSDIKPPYLPQA